MIGDGHTRVNATPKTVYPLVCRWYPDGVYVVSAHETWRDSLGKRVTAIGGVSVSDAASMLDSVISSGP